MHFIHPLKERIVREVGYGLSLEGASAADLVKSMRVEKWRVNRSRRKEEWHDDREEQLIRPRYLGTRSQKNSI